jgi:hypothetical protein
LQIGHQIDRDLKSGKARRVVEKDRQQNNESVQVETLPEGRRAGSAEGFGQL